MRIKEDRTGVTYWLNGAIETMEPAESVNVYDGQLKCCDQQCQRQRGAQGATRAQDSPACAVKI